MRHGSSIPTKLQEFSTTDNPVNTSVFAGHVSSAFGSSEASTAANTRLAIKHCFQSHKVLRGTHLLDKGIYLSVRTPLNSQSILYFIIVIKRSLSGTTAARGLKFWLQVALGVPFATP